MIAEKIIESRVITSFILRPVDGGLIFRHQPGQYLTLRFDAMDSLKLKRNYSISCAPNDAYYRITVKREANGNGGSRTLHDRAEVGDGIELTPPAGDFFFKKSSDRPIILLSRGVRLTPMVRILETIVIEHTALKVFYIHSTKSSATHAMGAHVHALAQKHGGITVSTFYSDPSQADVLGVTHDVDGLITTDWLSQNTPLADADIYLCGAKSFLQALVAGLSNIGVPSDQMHYEFFYPTDVKLRARPSCGNVDKGVHRAQILS